MRQPLYNAGNETSMLVVGIVAAILLAVGLLPPYAEIWKRRGRVIGLSWVGTQTQTNSSCCAVRRGHATDMLHVLGLPHCRLVWRFLLSNGTWYACPLRP